MRWPFATRRERLRRTAADWIARLNGPAGPEERAEFARWYSQDPDHAAAFDRLSRLFQMAGQARRPDQAETAPSAANLHGPRPIRYILAAATVAAALVAFVFLSARTAAPLPGFEVQVASFSAEQGERRVMLADGSEVLLAEGSRVEVSLTQGERRLRLVSGEARFTVAHETRPFIVAAAGTEVFARGTQFVVRVASERTTIALIEGSVEVSYDPSGSGQRRLARMAPGQHLVVQTGLARGSGSAAGAGTIPDPAGSTAPPEMLVFDDTPLGQAIEQANRRGSPPIRLGDPSLARLRITGGFRPGDTAAFAESIAAAFDLQLDRSGDGTLLLRPRAAPAHSG